MIRVKFMEDMTSGSGFCPYNRETFVKDVLGSFDEPRVPPFRDPESLLFIREIDHAHLVDGDWYSYVSPFGRTCMSSLCGGTQYALTVIYNSRKGIYTAFAGYGDDIWQRLQNLDMEVLVVLNPAHYGRFFFIPFQLKGCVVESVRVGGKIYQNAVYDATCREGYTDEAGVFHFSGLLDDYKDDYEWNWPQHLEEIFEYFVQEAKIETHFPPMQPTALMIPSMHRDFAWPRNILCCSDAFVMEGYDSYPQALCLYKHRDGTYTVKENGTCKRPDFYLVLHHVIEWWADDCEAAFYVFIDRGIFNDMDDFKEKRLWYFEDDGKTLRAYSGMRGLRRLLEFADNSWKDGRMRAEE